MLEPFTMVLPPRCRMSSIVRRRPQPHKQRNRTLSSSIRNLSLVLLLYCCYNDCMNSISLQQQPQDDYNTSNYIQGVYVVVSAGKSIVVPSKSNRKTILSSILVRGAEIISNATSSATTNAAACTATYDSSTTTEKQQRMILDFLKNNHDTVVFDKNNNNFLTKFHIHGWRWHTMSFIYEMKRLNQLAAKMSSTTGSLPSLQQAVDYVIGFNMKGLHNIERDLFFPWMRKQMKTKLIPQQSNNGKDVVKSFQIVMDELEQNQKLIQGIGLEIVDRTSSTSDTTRKRQQRNQPTENESKSDLVELSTFIAMKSQSMIALAESMLRTEENVMIPLIGQYISEQEQKTFNNQVIRKLGIFDSRLHLVGMYETIVQNQKNELKLFQSTIPYIAQSMIPRWKRLLYDPKVSMMLE